MRVYITDPTLREVVGKYIHDPEAVEALVVDLSTIYKYMRPTRYRVRIYDVVAKQPDLVEALGMTAVQPQAAKPHVGAFGWVEDDAFSDVLGRTNPKITLDDGTVLWGYECWWQPVFEDEGS